MPRWEVILWLCLVASVLGYVAVALIRLHAFRRWLRAKRLETRVLPAVSILKPLSCYAPELEEALASFCRQDYPAAVEIVFGLSNADPALEDLIRSLQARFPEVAMRVAKQPVIVGANPKVNNLAAMLPLASHRFLVLSDADVVVSADYLRRLIPPLLDERVGAVTCLYTGRAVDTALWSSLLVAYLNSIFLPAVLVGLIGRRNAYGFGATLALRRETLEAIGGWSRLAAFLADDFHLARAVEELGRRVCLAPLTVVTLVHEASLGELFAHQLRWARTIRFARPWGHAFSFFTLPLILALVALVLRPGRPSVLLLMVPLAFRLFLAQLLAGQPPRPFGRRLLTIVLAEFLAWAVWLWSFTGRTVIWQGRRYHLEAGGRLVPAACAEEAEVRWRRLRAK